ncbi:MAG: HIT family protein [Anaerolineales bacterium]|nr:HIT family protein [Anaerolineales bacterium]
MPKPDANEVCFVCRKHRGEIHVPGGVVFEDELFYVGHSNIPEGEERVYLGMLLIEPRHHAAAFEDLTETEARELGWLITRVSRALKQVTQAEHIYVFRLGHHVDHLHVWVIPRYPGTPRAYWGLNVDKWPDAPTGGEAEIAALCAQVRELLAAD